MRLKRDISFGQLVLLSLGGIIGAGIFLATSLTIPAAGPGVIISYLIGGVIMACVVSFLAEMTTAQPVAGGFSHFAGETLGPYAGFITGWMYWTAGVLTMSSEATAAGIFARWWWPHFPLWGFTLISSLLLTGANLMDVKGFGRVESSLAVIKVAALIFFIVAGSVFWLGFLPGHPSPGLANFLGHGGFLPKGWTGVGSALLLVMFAYAGTSVIGLAAAETKDPAQTMPGAIRAITLAVTVLYIGTVTVLVGILPWWELTPGISPMVRAFGLIGLPRSSDLMNLVVLTAVLSSLNAAMYGVSRMLYALAGQGEAPGLFARLNRHGVPQYSVLLSSLFLLLASLLAYVLPHQVFLYLTSSSGFVSMFNWIVISLTHYYFRGMMKKKNPAALRYLAWGHPYTSLLTTALILGVLASAYLVPGQRVGFAGGLALWGLYSLVFLLRNWRRGVR
ncbi:MAG: amino acid permease [Firmicutes bacterium]|nr:amino acid permease [Bacillota bacterium]MCL5040436.1 amino acid permease [Bacillota bacterium]